MNIALTMNSMYALNKQKKPIKIQRMGEGKRYPLTIKMAQSVARKSQMSVRNHFEESKSMQSPSSIT
jgi:hypothetical protein